MPLLDGIENQNPRKMTLDLKISSYNCRGLPKTKRQSHLRPDLLSLFNTSDIVLLQETWFSTQELNNINNIFENFHGFGVSTVNLSEGILYGHPPGGVAIFWRDNYDGCVKPLSLGLNWCTALQLSIMDRQFIIFNVYLPYQCAENEGEYVEKLAILSALIQEQSTTCYAILGDYNANMRDIENSLFAKHLITFNNDNNLHLSSSILLPRDSYTYVSESWNSVSWLDHVISTSDFHECIADMSVAHHITDEDHIPVMFKLSVHNAPSVTKQINEISPRNNWRKLSQNEQTKYCALTDSALKNDISIPSEVVKCTNLQCSNELHIRQLHECYESIVKMLVDASDNVFVSHKQSVFNPVPGWSHYVSEFYTFSRECRIKWQNAGKPRYGPLYDLYVRSKARFKYVLRSVKSHEQCLRQESLANKFKNSSTHTFWKEIKQINNSNIPLPGCIDGIMGEENIVNLWRNHYSDLLNCLGRTNNLSNSFDLDTDISEVTVSVEEVKNAICELENDKASGLDGIQAEHLKFCSTRILPYLSMIITGFFVHGSLPESMLSVILVPVIKDKAGSIASKENYRPIALASVLSKVIEKIMLNRLVEYFDTSPNQFGFKRKHGTDQCIYVLKEVIDLYRNLDGSMFLCFLDASKAFDRINHNILFNKLRKRNIPGYLIRVLTYWYDNQKMCVKWGASFSEYFTVSNGVRQGGILSPYLFNVYTDDLSKVLNACHVGFSLNGLRYNHLLYADDLVIFSPSSRGLRLLLSVCEQYGLEHDIKYNAKKSVIMICRSKLLRNVDIPPFVLNGVILKEVTQYKYLGYIISNDMTDDLDIERQRRQIFVQGNQMLRKFFMCNTDVKVQLFKSFCSPMYVPYLWSNYKENTMRKLNTAYHNVCKLLLSISKYESTSLVCSVYDIQCCKAIIRRLTYKFICRLENSNNALLNGITNSSMRYKSKLWHTWNRALYINHTS